MHARSFSNPVFLNQYFGELVPALDDNPALVDEARKCIACHSPIAAEMEPDRVVTKVEDVSLRFSGVTCDFCHTMTGHIGEEPGDGNYISTPGMIKYGPIRCQAEWHRKYSAFHRRSEFCGVCHEGRNYLGLATKTTYSEWKQSKYALEGIQCQDCHMNVVGFLTGGRPLFEPGYVAETPAARVPMRGLYTHRFPGAHSYSQVIGALTIQVRPRQNTVRPGEKIEIDVYVDNSRAGHKMPTGSADLRMMWLELNAYIDGEGIPVRAHSEREGGVRYDVAGEGNFDEKMLDHTIPAGSRIYRTIFVDPDFRQTFSSYKARDIIFDNRLEAAEIRRETYTFIVPSATSEYVAFQAVLRYLPYPYPFARQVGIPRPEAVEIAVGRAGIRIE